MNKKSPKYNWTRYWLPFDSTYNTDILGFPSFRVLQLIGEQTRGYVNIGKTLNELQDRRCLILLGEPGTGKTTTVNDYLQPEHSILIKHNLGSCSTEHILYQDLNEKIDEAISKSANKIIVFLDALDEAMIYMPKIDHSLAAWIQRTQQKIEKHLDKESPPIIHFRITCRSTAWSRQMKIKLDEIFGENGVDMYELAPLRQDDLKIVASENNFDPEGFVTSISRAGLVTFATEPASISFLVGAMNSGRLSSKDKPDKAELFKEGCLHLCKELNDTYLQTAHLTEHQRLVIASRIATTMMLTGKTELTSDEVISLSNALSINDIVNDGFKWENQLKTITWKELKEVINTTLFSATGYNTFVFKHKTYSEFLTAWHLTNVNPPSITLKTLLMSPMDRRRIVPQIQEIITWVCTLNEDVFELLVDKEPLQLLRSQREFDEEEKKDVVTSLLKMSKEAELIDGLDTRRYYDRLAHKGIVQQLRPIINNKALNDVCRRIAIDIAGACKLDKLSGDLFNRASDPDEDEYIRRECIRSLADMNKIDVIAKLKRYAVGTQSDDPRDQLKGEVLKNIYPTHLDTREMIFSLSHRRRRSLHGSYQAFQSTVGDSIPEHDLPAAIKAILDSHILINVSSNSEFKDLIGKIVLRGWQYTNFSEIQDSFATLLITLKKQHVYFPIYENDEIRRTIIIAIIEQLKTSTEIVRALSINSYPQTALLQANDWDWLCGILTKVVDIEKRKGIAKSLIRRMPQDDQSSNKLLELLWTDNDIVLDNPFILGTVDLHSTAANELRRELNLRNQASVKEQQLAKANPGQRFLVNEAMEFLNKYEAGNINAFWKALECLSFSVENGLKYDYSHHLRIPELPAWPHMNESQKQRTLVASKAYILQYKSNSTSWMAKNTVNKPQLALYRALLLAGDHDPSSLAGIEADFWSHWRSLIIYYSLYQTNSFTEAQSICITSCYKSSPSRFNAALRSIIKNLTKSPGTSFAIAHLVDVIDDDGASILLTLIGNPNCSHWQEEQTLELLTDTNLPKFEKYCHAKLKRFVASPALAAKADHLLLLTKLILKINNKLWPLMYQLIHSNQSLGVQIFQTLGRRPDFHESNSLVKLNIEYRKKLSSWLYLHFEKIDDQTNAPSNHPTEYVIDYARSILDSMVNEGSPESFAALQKLASQHPESDFKWSTVKAGEIMRRNLWHPPSPQQLLNLLNEFDHRIIRSRNELNELVIESLARLQRKLKGNNPTSMFLWDKNNKGYKPKDENSLSDFVKMHLEYDLADRNIVVNREVEIKRSTGKKDGQRTDVFVQAVREGQDAISLVIETKLCSNVEVKTAMETQLKKRYMSEYKTNTGIYLIGWFYCAHYPNIKSGSDLTKTKTIYQRQAQSLSVDNVKIESFIIDCTI